MGFDTGSTRYVDLGDWSGSTCAVNPATCQQGKENDFEQYITKVKALIDLLACRYVQCGNLEAIVNFLTLQDRSVPQKSWHKFVFTVFLGYPSIATNVKRLNEHFGVKTKITRKSSCVNVRGIPTEAYQVLHLLPEVGYPPSRDTPLARSNPPRPGPTGGEGLPEVWTDRWTDTCQNITFPSYYVRGQ